LSPRARADTLPQRGLAHAGRSDEAQDWTAPLRVQLAHGEVLENAALDLVEAVVVLVEDATRTLDVDVSTSVVDHGRDTSQSR